jgi:Salmonella virulence-associated 28kDa protein
MRTYDTDVSTPDQSKWRYTGDKVHVSVQWERVPDAGDLMLLILLAHPDTIKEFKVTNMEEIGRKLDNETARRIYYGAQISVYLRVAPGDEADAAGRFARVMMTVSPIMRDAGIKPGQQPGSDLTVNPYVSFRHDYDDLIDPEKFKALKQVVEGGMSEEQFYGLTSTTIRDSDPRYAKHRELMESRPLYRAMRAMQLPPLPPIPR